MTQPLDCFWEPEDPRCCNGSPCPIEDNVIDNKTARGSDHDNMEQEDGMMMMMRAPWAAQVVYLCIAMGMTTRAGIKLFHFENGDTMSNYWTGYDYIVKDEDSTINWYKLAW